MKTLKQAIMGLNQTYNDIDIAKKWLKSARGASFALNLDCCPIDELEARMQAPKLHTRDTISRRNIYKSAAKELKLPTSRFKAPTGSSKVKLVKQSHPQPKLLTKAERRAIFEPIVRDINGNPMQATDKRGRMLWNNRTNRPIYKRKRPNKRLQLAEKCHMYELAKMAKWDRKNPYPTKKALCEELFPDYVIAMHRTRRGLYQEHVRNILAELYCGTSIVEPLLRLYAEHHNTTGTGNTVVYEQECDPYIYGYPFTGRTMPSREEIHSKLITAATHADKTVVSLKVYDHFGTMRDIYRVAA